MVRRRKIAVASLTILVAAAAGEYVQNHDGRRAGHWQQPPDPVIHDAQNGGKSAGLRSSATASTSAGAAAGAPSQIVPLIAADAVKLPQTQPMPMLPQPSPKVIRLPQDRPVGRPPRENSPTSGPAVTQAAAGDGACTPRLAVTVEKAAMLRVVLDAPCHPDKVAIFNVSGLSFTQKIPVSGQLALKIPSMARNVTIQARFGDGARASASALVADQPLFERVAVQWMAPDHFDLHALQFGAGYGSSGDIRHDNRGSVEQAVRDRSGFLTVLGDGAGKPALWAAVYTLPADLSLRSGAVRLTLDAPLDQATCGREMFAQTLTSRAAGPAHVRDLHVAMPACADAGTDQIVGLTALLGAPDRPLPGSAAPKAGDRGIKDSQRRESSARAISR